MANLKDKGGKDHPRLRGEHDNEDRRGYFVTGSPPPTRGTPPMFGDAGTGKRITPAYAGNTDLWVEEKTPE